MERPEFLPDRIVKRLKDTIASGELAPGEQLPPETVLAKRFGVGRSTIREAKKALSLIGLLDVRVGTGSYVHRDAIRRLDLSRVFDESRIPLLEIFEGRKILEGGIVALAAERATPQDLLDMRLAVDRLAAAARADDVAGVFAADSSFHLALARAAHNGYLYRAFDETRGLLEAAVSSISHAPDNTDMAVASHRAVLAAIQARDVRRARVALLHHLQDSWKTIEAALA